MCSSDLGVQRVAVGAKRRETAGRDVGLLVTALSPGGPAELGGLLLGDILLDLDGRAVADPRDVLDVLDAAADRTLPVRLLRGDALVEQNVTPGIRPSRGCR